MRSPDAGRRRVVPEGRACLKTNPARRGRARQEPSRSARAPRRLPARDALAVARDPVGRVGEHAVAAAAAGDRVRDAAVARGRVAGVDAVVAAARPRGWRCRGDRGGGRDRGRRRGGRRRGPRERRRRRGCRRRPRRRAASAPLPPTAGPRRGRRTGGRRRHRRRGSRGRRGRAGGRRRQGRRARRSESARPASVSSREVPASCVPRSGQPGWGRGAGALGGGGGSGGGGFAGGGGPGGTTGGGGGGVVAAAAGTARDRRPIRQWANCETT